MTRVVSPHLRRVALPLIPALFVADQVSKWLILERIPEEGFATVTPFLALVHARNTGISFSLFASDAGWVQLALAALALAITAALCVWLVRAMAVLTVYGLSLVIGGALGNVLDRLLHGSVTDFLLFHAGGLAFPAFNLADSGITIGVVLILLDGLLTRPARQPTPAAASPASPGPGAPT